MVSSLNLMVAIVDLMSMNLGIYCVSSWSLVVSVRYSGLLWNWVVDVMMMMS